MFHLGPVLIREYLRDDGRTCLGEELLHVVPIATCADTLQMPQVSKFYRSVPSQNGGIRRALIQAGII